MKLRKLVRRLSRMSGHEIYTRSRQAVSKRADVLLHAAGVDPFRHGTSDLDSRGRFFCYPQDVPSIVEIPPTRMPEQVDRIVASSPKHPRSPL